MPSLRSTEVCFLPLGEPILLRRRQPSSWASSNEWLQQSEKLTKGNFILFPSTNSNTKINNEQPQPHRAPHRQGHKSPFLPCCLLLSWPYTTHSKEISVEGLLQSATLFFSIFFGSRAFMKTLMRWTANCIILSPCSMIVFSPNPS